MRLLEFLVSMVKNGNTYRVLVGKPEGKRPLGRPRHGWENNIKMEVKVIGWESVGWIYLPKGWESG
jgi:hypothetical protein